MHEFQGLQPQDFQKAWPQAYMLAVQQVNLLHEQAGHQMASATQQVLLAQRIAEATAVKLESAKSDIVEAIESANREHLASAARLSDALALELKMLMERERSFLCCVMVEKSKIDQARTQLVEELEKVRNGAFWRRLCWAFRPESIACLTQTSFTTPDERSHENG